MDIVDVLWDDGVVTVADDGVVTELVEFDNVLCFVCLVYRDAMILIGWKLDNSINPISSM